MAIDRRPSYLTVYQISCLNISSRIVISKHTGDEIKSRFSFLRTLQAPKHVSFFVQLSDAELRAHVMMHLPLLMVPEYQRAHACIESKAGVTATFRTSTSI